ncbi:branched-chain amino acid transport system II carrier protein [Legionella septentrionalis]|uniref:branched-chain amino acid transport system II carrier protein n=1 Tax=Legionella septentrionalis TaxID=2498109 RepID=UPI000F8D0000|nr:branched-chain amino acid transport system II carrier protein [Legionella septentrionalis]RUR11709.1 hypothetical protein ELY14_00230 [Legionella septentrionalis]
MSQTKSILMYGFAIFAMFFGSGNLVFPLQIGYADGAHWLLGFAGLLITGILLPFLGLFVIKLYHGDYQQFFAGAGKTASVFLPFAMLSLLGAFGVVPRCITVAYGSMRCMMPEMSLTLFSLLFCLLTYAICLNDKLMIKILGKWISPVLLAALLILTLVAVFCSPAAVTPQPAQTAFLTGFYTGYQTMDLFAAFFFSALTFAQIQKHMPDATNREILRFAIKPNIVAAILLALVYLGFVYMGAHYSFLMQDVAAESMLPTIAQYTMGNRATQLIGITVLFSCLSTAVALNNLYARYLCNTLKFKENKFHYVLVGTTLISFAISLLDFRGIAAFLQPALEIFYPGVIALTIISIACKQRQRLKKFLFYGITLFTIGYGFF